jgi:hypothetical protein
MTGKSKETVYQYLFTCEVKDMAQVESDLKQKFFPLREEKSKEIYFYNSYWFNEYVKFINTHGSFLKEIYIKTLPNKEIVKIIKKSTPSLIERGITRKEVMQKAQKAKNDEFYTRYEDIEREIAMYDPSIWQDKVVFCNCDDAVDIDKRRTSAFSLYFIRNFQSLGLKKLICTHYGGPIDLFNQGAKGYVFTKDGFREIKEFPKGYTGSFDEPLSIKILKEEADIVCTNPPFSRSIDYWKLVVNSGKKFLIISNETNPITPAFIPYFIEKKVWSGYNSVYEFLNYKREIVRATGRWYTNFAVKDRPKSNNIKIVPLKEIPDRYKKIDDYKMLVVNNSYIPKDYKKPFAVSCAPVLNGLLEKGYKIISDTQYFPYIKGKRCFGRVLVQKEGEE